MEAGIPQYQNRLSGLCQSVFFIDCGAVENRWLTGSGTSPLHIVAAPVGAQQYTLVLIKYSYPTFVLPVREALKVTYNQQTTRQRRTAAAESANYTPMKQYWEYNIGSDTGLNINRKLKWAVVMPGSRVTPCWVTLWRTGHPHACSDIPKIVWWKVCTLTTPILCVFWVVPQNTHTKKTPQFGVVWSQDQVPGQILLCLLCFSGEQSHPLMGTAENCHSAMAGLITSQLCLISTIAWRFCSSTKGKEKSLDGTRTERCCKSTSDKEGIPQSGCLSY